MNINRIEINNEFANKLIESSLKSIDDSKEKTPTAYLSLMKVPDFLILTTLGNWEATEIIRSTKDNARFLDSKGKRTPVWNNDRVENLEVDSIPELWVDSEGQIKMHDGRHRTAIAIQSMIPLVPVVIHCVDKDMNPSEIFPLEQLKDQYEFGERKTINTKAIKLLALRDDNRIREEIEKVHANSNAPSKDRNLDRDFTI